MILIAPFLILNNYILSLVWDTAECHPGDCFIQLLYLSGARLQFQAALLRDGGYQYGCSNFLLPVGECH